jgi:hypothetical protein
MIVSLSSGWIASALSEVAGTTGLPVNPLAVF